MQPFDLPRSSPPAARTPTGTGRRGRHASSARAYWTFWRRALRHQGRVGAVMPSSAGLGAVLACPVPTQGSPVVVELGPGTGAVCAQIERRLPDTARHVAIELDPVMAAWLAAAHPAIEVIQGNAVDLDRLLPEVGVDHADAVVSSLPWSLFDAATQTAVLAAVGRAIGGSGAFTTFGYLSGLPLSASRRFRRTLHDVFDEVVTTAPIWRNVPPAVVYVCRRPRAAAATP